MYFLADRVYMTGKFNFVVKNSTMISYRTRKLHTAPTSNADVFNFHN